MKEEKKKEIYRLMLRQVISTVRNQPLKEPSYTLQRLAKIS